MDVKLEYSDLLIEQGKLDPLSLWRVGDRLIIKLLPPMTTVVISRPARYINMYCWILSFLNNQKFNNDNAFWKRFFELESIFLCAIQFHSEHKYPDFTGQIGSKSAIKLISNNKGKQQIDFSGVKINNGWEVNYKNPMLQFKTTTVDFGITSKLKTTEIGNQLAQAYKATISNTDFHKNYLDSNIIPILVLKQLSEYSCPCLLYNPPTEDIKKECDISIKLFLEPPKETHDSESIYLWKSIELVIDFMKKLNEEGEGFNLFNWRKVLSTKVYSQNIEYESPESIKNVFKKWQIYNLDSLLVYGLESCLSGFLELMHANQGHIKISDISYDIFKDSFKKISDNLINSNKFLISDSVQQTMSYVKNLDTLNLLNLENALIEAIKTASRESKMIYSLLFSIYVLSVFSDKCENPEYTNAIDFYEKLSNQDGHELSLNKCYGELSKFEYLQTFFIESFLHQWVIQRQLKTREERGKEVAWFSKSNETYNYEWENNYDSHLYRASRINILMTFLQNMHLVERSDNNWIISNY